MTPQDPGTIHSPPTVRQLFDSVRKRLPLKLLAGAGGLDNRVVSPRIQKLGLALAGYQDYLHPGRVQFIGRTEIDYLKVLPPQQSLRAVSDIFSSGLCCIVITKGLAPPPEITRQADQHAVPLFQTDALSSKAISEVTSFLDRGLAPNTAIHGVLTDVFGLGVLLLGESGIGKSECALDLIMRGHRLVSDDLVVIRRFEPGELIGSGPDSVQFLMEVRGLGILNIKDLFGVSAVSPSKPVHLVIHLVRWQADAHYDRLGLEEEEHTVLEVPVPSMTLPVAPGRHLASLVEVAVRIRLLRNQGYNSARNFVQEMESRLKSGGDSPALETDPARPRVTASE
ncbi:MAG: HPr(Ser) kinase/phosphatase [Acidobacteriota bacterium]